MFYALNSFCTIILTFDYDGSVMVCYCVGVSYILKCSKFKNVITYIRMIHVNNITINNK